MRSAGRPMRARRVERAFTDEALQRNGSELAMPSER
jgi:hypothetical protein